MSSASALSVLLPPLVFANSISAKSLSKRRKAFALPSLMSSVFAARQVFHVTLQVTFAVKKPLGTLCCVRDNKQVVHVAQRVFALQLCMSQNRQAVFRRDVLGSASFVRYAYLQCFAKFFVSALYKREVFSCKSGNKLHKN